MNTQLAWVEQPFNSGTEKWLKTRIRPILKDESERLMQSGAYSDIESVSQNAQSSLELLFGGKLKALSSTFLHTGSQLELEIDAFGEEGPVKAVAVVARQLYTQLDGMYVSALRFCGVAKVNAPEAVPGFTLSAHAVLPEYLAWA